ncbi:MAG: hypothetical protein JSU70_17850 [Phycisphaerales bacterium]|nr:MAG: hypothetical protein JSU70_17850 [Phycisphaerales bacterium]
MVIDLIRCQPFSRRARTTVPIIAVVSILVGQVSGYSPAMRRAMLAGPWEIVVQNGMEGPSMRFPLKVADDNKVTGLDAVLPLTGSPIKIKLVKYLPDLKWEMSAASDPNGGIVAKLKAQGKNLSQDIWLSSSDRARRAISSRIGGVRILGLRRPKQTQQIAQELTRSKSVGIVSVWEKDAVVPLEYVVGTGKTITLPGSDRKLAILRYMPHYSIDTKTKEVVNQSNEPVNPAVEVRFSDNGRVYEQWIWSKFPTSPHAAEQLPLRVEFADCDLDGAPGKYILMGGHGAEPWLFYSKQGNRTCEKAKLKHPYPFADAAYSFSIEEYFTNAIVKSDWKNGSEELMHPALVATIAESEKEEQVVLELNKPTHHKAKSGMIVIVYRREASEPGPAN